MVQMVPDSLMVFSGNANPKLAQAVVQHLNIPLGRATVSRFSDGEVQVELNENVRGRDVFIIQPTCQPTNDNLMEFILICWRYFVRICFKKPATKNITKIRR